MKKLTEKNKPVASNQPKFAPQAFTDADAALAHVCAIYDDACGELRQRFTEYARGGPISRTSRGYPFVEIRTESRSRPHTPLSYGFVPEPGTYRTSLTRPDLFNCYYRHQFEQLIVNHGVPIIIGESNEAIPIHFSFKDGIHIEGDIDNERLKYLRDVFDTPSLEDTDDKIANGTFTPPPGSPRPLALFTAARVDFSLHRLRHYTATSPDKFQNFVLFTNYQFYVDEFVRLGLELMSKAQDSAAQAQRLPYKGFCEPGDVITYNANRPDLHEEGNANPNSGRPKRLPQMPAYHLMAENGNGITLVNIGVGPSNAKTITDHIAVLRPHAWVMLGHCAGLRSTQRLGDYVLAHAYVRDDHVLDADLPLWVPVPALAEVQQALEEAVGQVTGLHGYDLKMIMRTGTVATIDNRNWELREYAEPVERFSQSRAIALDMESATIAANGFRFRVPYGTLLCVSDKPLHGEIKLPLMADAFYSERVGQHLMIGLKAMEILQEWETGKLHSRKLRSFQEVPFL